MSGDLGGLSLLEDFLVVQSLNYQADPCGVHGAAGFPGKGFGKVFIRISNPGIHARDKFRKLSCMTQLAAATGKDDPSYSFLLKS